MIYELYTQVKLIDILFVKNTALELLWIDCLNRALQILLILRHEMTIKSNQLYKHSRRVVNLFWFFPYWNPMATRIMFLQNFRDSFGIWHETSNYRYHGHKMFWQLITICTSHKIILITGHFIDPDGHGSGLGGLAPPGVWNFPTVRWMGID